MEPPNADETDVDAAEDHAWDEGVSVLMPPAVANPENGMADVSSEALFTRLLG